MEGGGGGGKGEAGVVSIGRENTIGGWASAGLGSGKGKFNSGGLPPSAGGTPKRFGGITADSISGRNLATGGAGSRVGKHGGGGRETSTIGILWFAGGTQCAGIRTRSKFFLSSRKLSSVGSEGS